MKMKWKIVLVALVLIVLMSIFSKGTGISSDAEVEEMLLIEKGMGRARCLKYKPTKEELKKDIDIEVVYCKCKKNDVRVDYVFSKYKGKLYPAFGKSFKLLGFKQGALHPLWVNNVEAYSYLFNQSEKKPSISIRPNFFKNYP